MPRGPRAPRVWTIVIVPSDANARTRTLVIPIRWLLAVGAAVVISSMGGGRWVAVRSAEGAIHAEQLVAAQSMLRTLRDSVQRLRDRPLQVAGDAADPASPGGPPGSRAADARPLAPADGVVLPVAGKITSGFGAARYHPLLQVFRPHNGVDVSAPAGTPITAPAPGRVRFVGWRFGEGLVVELEHGGDVVTRYAHCRSAAVEEGAQVEAGATIATVGMTGLATGPHLHFEVVVAGQKVDPLRYAIRDRQPLEETLIAVDDDEDARS